MKILVADDDPQILDALTAGFQMQWRDSTVITGQDGETGLQRFYEDQPDVVVLDVAMPRRNGLEVLEEIRRVSNVPVIVMTARGEEGDQIRALELGADDYVVKPFGHLALLARIKSVLSQTALATPGEALQPFVDGDLTINFQSYQVTLRGNIVKLTPVEYRLLYELVRSDGRQLTKQDLHDRVWGEGHHVTLDHLEIFMNRLRAKLETYNTRYIQATRGSGYRLVKSG